MRALPATIDTFAVLYPQLKGLDLRTRAAQLQVPVYVVSGEFEACGRIGPARAWFDVLAAPDNGGIELPQAGHRPQFEQPDGFGTGAHRVRRPVPHGWVLGGEEDHCLPLRRVMRTVLSGILICDVLAGTGLRALVTTVGGGGR